MPWFDYCNREPDVVSIRRSHHWLWPGKQITTAQVAIQANDGLQLGDQLRWNVFPRGTEEVVIASAPFVVDERPKRVPALR
jgi:hypothetical protein